MRTLRYQTLIGLIALTLFNTAHAELIYGFKKVSVTKELTTTVEFEQDDLKKYKTSDNLKLRVKSGDNIIREDVITKKGDKWTWNKALPFSDDLKLTILKNDTVISTEYLADNKSLLAFSETESLNMIRSVHALPVIHSNSDKVILPVELPKELKTCKDKILAVVFDKAKNALLWQYYGEFKEDLKTDEIDNSENVQVSVITDEGSCQISASR